MLFWSNLILIWVGLITVNVTSLSGGLKLPAFVIGAWNYYIELYIRTLWTTTTPWREWQVAYLGYAHNKKVSLVFFILSLLLYKTSQSMRIEILEL